MAASSTESPTTQDETETELERRARILQERMYSAADSLDAQDPKMLDVTEMFLTGYDRARAASGRSVKDMLTDPNFDPSCFVVGQVTTEGSDLRAMNEKECACALKKKAEHAPIPAKVYAREFNLVDLVASLDYP